VNAPASLRIDRARWWALQNQPFYGALAMNLPDVLDGSIETAATDGTRILWNPTFVDTLSDPELRFVLLHETLHCAHQHMWRLPADQQGNTAGDHEINLLLRALDGVSMPDGGLADPRYTDMSCEDILRALGAQDPPQGCPIGDPQGGGQDDPQQGQEDPQGGQGGQGGQDDTPGKPGGQDDGQGGGGQKCAADPCGTFTAPADPGGQQDPQQAAQASQDLRDSWAGKVIAAAQASQALGIGDIPGDIERMLDKMRHQPVDWRREMADFVRDAMSTRNDWTRASRRHAWQSVIYPRRRADEVGRVIFARDTSGSVDDRTCAQYSALITDCMSETGCDALVIDCDARIRAEYELTGFDACPLTAVGGGGTDFRPVFDRADELIAAGEHIAGIVYLTDLMGPMPAMSDVPTLWLATSAAAAPFGRTVRIEV
jgi:predicted metal-dependent peptidase